MGEGRKLLLIQRKLRSYRKTVVEAILPNHDVTCPTCPANNKCELQSLANNLGVDSEALPNILVKTPAD